MARQNELVIENARIGMKNFSGAEKQFNRAGCRNFVVFLDEDIARKLVEDGWRIKYLKPLAEGDPEQPILKVEVSYKVFPPKIVRIAGKTKLALVEDTVGTLDREKFVSADLIISPYHWEMNGNNGIKAYLKTAYITVEQDPFEAKYVFDDGMDDCPFEM